MAGMERPEVEWAKGLWIGLKNGRNVLDAESGTFNLPLGYYHEKVERAVQQQQPSFLPSDFDHEQLQMLRKKLQEIGHPFGLERLWFRDLTGSTANECAVKIAQLYTGKSGIVSFDKSHHGQTITTTAISGNDFRREGIPANTVPYAHRLPLGATLHDLETLYTSQNGNIAAIFIEPVLGNGGNIMHQPDFLKDIRGFCHEHDIILVVDEVQTGIGRTGEMLGCETLKIEPDIVTLAKGLANGYPIGAVLMRQEFDILASHQHSFTSGSHLSSAAAANATLDIISEPHFLETVRRNALLIKHGLLQLKRKHPCIGEVRGVGFMWGFDVITPKLEPDAFKTNAIVKTGIEKYNLRLRSSQYSRGNVVKVRPALIATPEELHEIIHRLDQTIEAVTLRRHWRSPDESPPLQPKEKPHHVDGASDHSIPPVESEDSENKGDLHA